MASTSRWVLAAMCILSDRGYYYINTWLIETVFVTIGKAPIVL